jgi:hypothetical protein
MILLTRSLLNLGMSGRICLVRVRSVVLVAGSVQLLPTRSLLNLGMFEQICLVLVLAAAVVVALVATVLVAVVHLPLLFDPTRGLSARLVTGLVICNAKWLDTSFWKKSMGVRVPVT